MFLHGYGSWSGQGVPVNTRKAGAGARFRREGGFSMLEVLLSFALLSLISVTFITALITNANSVIKADGMVTAEALAKSEIEYIKAAEYTGAPWTYQLPGTPPSWDAAHALAEEYSEYIVNVTASELDRQGEEIQQIVVTVTRSTADQRWKFASYTITNNKVNR